MHLKPPTTDVGIVDLAGAVATIVALLAYAARRLNRMFTP